MRLKALCLGKPFFIWKQFPRAAPILTSPPCTHTRTNGFEIDTPGKEVLGPINVEEAFLDQVGRRNEVEPHI